MKSRKGLRLLLGICSLSLAFGLLSATSQAGYAQTKATGAAKSRVASSATVINVTAGKPSELAFKLSRFSSLPVGTITFNVKNSGHTAHDFKLCTIKAATAAHNSCVGLRTQLLQPGQSATLTVKITKKGTYEYLCAVPGHAAAGMKGLIGVGVAVKAPTAKPAGGKKPICPNGQTVAQASPIGDNDADNSPGGPDDQDGCL